MVATVKLFKKGAEIRFTREDLMALLQYSLNDRVLSFHIENVRVTDIKLTPANKYAATITVEPPVNEKG